MNERSVKCPSCEKKIKLSDCLTLHKGMLDMRDNDGIEYTLNFDYNVFKEILAEVNETNVGEKEDDLLFAEELKLTYDQVKLSVVKLERLEHESVWFVCLHLNLQHLFLLCQWL